ncbi:hypothetical protein L9F63_007646 [Diploptera punctata]|uniref:TELO2-interacting protein 1 homolog n=1 Tax=Diploptera punctata TaxID=6984 RepID=A0AAD8E350_DIPPU|nr:hypothetical protein L9F63_007646 [Diploptera punctata]
MPPGEAFNNFKPVCNRIMKEPTKDNLFELKSLLGNVSSITEEISNYILYPLQLYLQVQGLRMEIKHYLIDCMKEVFNRSEIKYIEKLFKLNSLLFFQIFDTKKSNLVGDVPEELKLNVVQCVISLFKCATTDIINNSMYDKKYAPKMAQNIYICLQLAQFEKLRSLRISAIECLMILAYVHDDSDKDDIVLRHQAGDVIMFFLPGIVSTLQKIATGDEKQGHQITVIAVKAWAQIIALVMDDKYNPPETSEFRSMGIIPNSQSTNNEKKDPLANDWDKGNKESLMKSIQEKCRTTEWYSAAGEKLALSVKVMAAVQKNSHWKVRHELATDCNFLLSRCCRNLKPCVMDLVEVIIALSEDENENVTEISKSGLRMFSEKCKKEEGKSFLEMLEDNFYIVVTKLPRILHGTDDIQQLSTLRLLAGYIKLLGANKLPQVLTSAAHLNRLMLTLIQAVELENSASLLEDYSLRDLEANHAIGHSVPWKQFKHFMDDSILQKMVCVCHLLGKYGDLETLTYHLLDIFHNNSQHRKEVILLLNEILIGGATRYDVNLKPIVESVLEAYLEPSVWYVNISIENSDSEDEESVTTLKEAQSNVVQVCLLVEGVGKMAEVLGSGFDVFLLKTLYVVLERAGSTNALITAAGMVAAQDIASACGHGNSVIDLVQANADYFSFHVTTRLQSVAENPGVMDVLNVIMKYSTINVLQYLDEIIEEALQHCSDAFQAQNALSYLRVFYTFVVSVRHWLESEENMSCKSTDSTIIHTGTFPRTLIPGQVVSELVEYHKCKKQSQDFSDKHYINDSENNSFTEEFAPEEETKKKKKLPLHVTMTVSVLEKCVNFLPTKKKEQKLIVLSILEEGLLILKKWENELLPIVHTIWSPFVERFNELKDPLVVNRSFGLLCILAKTAKDFIRSRTLKQVLPTLCQFLNKSAQESKKKDKGSTYRFTQIFKLQKELLSNIGDVIIYLGLSEREIDQVLSSACPYLSNLQPLPLQHACVDLFKKIATIDRDAVWLKVVNLWSPFQVLEPPFTGLQTIKIMQNGNQNNEQFKKNVEEILSFLNLNSN